MAKTMVIQIGNSDNRLSQQLWSQFIQDIQWACLDKMEKQHFGGGSPSEAAWQNYCYVIEVDDEKVDLLLMELIGIRIKYKQDSIAVVLGETKLL